MIIISFYNSVKFYEIIRLLKLFNLLEIKSKYKLINLLNLFNFEKINNRLINKIILKTFNLLILLDDKNIYFFWTNIMMCVKELKNYSNYLKLQIYMQIINQSISNIKNKYSINNIIDNYVKTIKIIKQN